jgi:predicted O-methyltransferase YrrM
MPVTEFLNSKGFYQFEGYADIPKQLEELIQLTSRPNISIMEIGFNAGHSTMLMLLGRDKSPLDFTIFDIGHHAYTKPCLNYIKSKFSHINFEYIEGDSIVSMPKWIEDNNAEIGLYDIIHIDGGHSDECISNDMKNANILVKRGGIVIIDDTNSPIINRYVNLYLSTDEYSEMNVLQTSGYPHRIIRKSQ